MRRPLLLLPFLLLAAGCAAQPFVSHTPSPDKVLPGTADSVAPLAVRTQRCEASPTEVGLDEMLPLRLDSIMGEVIAQGGTSGGAIAVGRHGRLVYLCGYGFLDWAEGSPAVDPSSIYDMASLTKVVATTTAAMVLEETGALDLDRPIRDYLPELDAPDKAAITARVLLNHRSGLAAGGRLWRELSGREAYLRAINAVPTEAEPGERTRYSDWGMILLGLALERIAGQPLDRFLEERVFRPLGMSDTGFNPEAELLPRIAPTEVDTFFRHRHVHGEVHDENAWSLGGVAGHAGLFSSARDLAVFAQMLLGGGAFGGVRIVQPTTIARWTAPQAKSSSRALGWDTPSPESSAGLYFSPRSFGHTGFTGTSLWVDPERSLFVVVLTNRVNPSRANDAHVPLRRAVANTVQAAVRDAPLIVWESRD
jgi:CubicO group peptidase (beta-lactamase class C family)